MRFEDKASLRAVGTKLVSLVAILKGWDGINGELVAYFDAFILWEFRDVPGGEAEWVAEVGALRGRLRAVEVAQEVKLFGGIVGVDVDSISHHLVGRVLDAPDTAGVGVLADADLIPQAPTKEKSVSLIGICLGTISEIECLDRSAASIDAGCKCVVVACASESDNEHVGSRLREK